ncbi:MBL fold metallo-hydrolase [Poseidonibacter lekithochrous]|uniref:MBL fold metallo-hydrolase n=1 Tax=Poseidonibacter lekithochrous TaxID=1904463 RepID=UPI0008FCD1BA|nr:MBL fold metallo-hydrolase [Poseidonibacter lekithochrous]
MKLILKIVLIAGGISGCLAKDNLAIKERIESSPQYKEGKFVNKKEMPDFEFSISEMYQGLKGIYFTEQPGSIPKELLPIKKVTYDNFYIDNKEAFHYTRLGHSSIMFQLEGKVWLTDPVFEDFITPYEWIGWKRFHPVPLDLDSVGQIEGIIISHDHYDHLEEEAIIRLKDKVNYFIVPLGVGKRLVEWGVPKEKIRSLDWWESTKIGDVELISTPSQHFSGRTLFDRASTLWSSWVVRANGKSLFFSGDSGYFDGFKRIGEKYGPFDITFMENGQYNERFEYIHMFPEQTIQAHKDLKGKLLVPIHNGTFKISFHPWNEPMERISTLAKKEKTNVLIPKMGEVIDILSPPIKLEEWWKK